MACLFAKRFHLIVICALVALNLSVVAAETGGGMVFEMEEFSIFDYEGPIKPRLIMGQAAELCGVERDERVKAYPKLRSKEPIYGAVTFGYDYFTSNPGVTYAFVIDKSRGNGKDYDRLYFDVNHDFDLSNDGVLKVVSERPKGIEKMGGFEVDEFFENLKLELDFGGEDKPVSVNLIPRFLKMEQNDYKMVSFLNPSGRKGKINVGSKEYEALLVQNPIITGTYDKPMVGFSLWDPNEQMPFLSRMVCEEGRFYSFAATRSGDKITVLPYGGEFGLFDVGVGDRKVKKAELEFGWFHTQEAMIDVGKFPREGSKVKLPVGDYRALRMTVLFGKLRVGVAADISRPGSCGTAVAKPTIFGIEIREDKPFVFDFSNKITPEFRNPVEKQRFKRDDEIKIEAALCDSVMGTLVAGLEDTTEKIGDPMKLPDGREYQRYKTLDPEVEIFNSSGKRVGEGKMPFG
jgi:hypothetical protein